MGRGRVIGLCFLCACKHHACTLPPPPAPAASSAPPAAPTALWTEEQLPDRDASVYALGGTSATDVWAVGSGIFHYDGVSWKSATPKTFIGSLYGISVVARDDVWAVGSHGNVAHFDGKSWSVTQPAVMVENKYTLAPYDLEHVLAWPGEAWAMPRAPNQPWFRFDGKSWTRVEQGAGELAKAWGAAPQAVWAPGESARHFDGATWFFATSFDKGEKMAAVHGSAADDVWMVGERTVYRGRGSTTSAAAYHYDGKSWDKGTISGKPLQAVYVASHKEAYALGEDTVMAWDGSAWRDIRSNLVGRYTLIYSPGGGVVFVAGDRQYVMHKQ